MSHESLMAQGKTPMIWEMTFELFLNSWRTLNNRARLYDFAVGILTQILWNSTLESWVYTARRNGPKAYESRRFSQEFSRPWLINFKNGSARSKDIQVQDLLSESPPPFLTISSGRGTLRHVLPHVGDLIPIDTQEQYGSQEKRGTPKGKHLKPFES